MLLRHSLILPVALLGLCSGCSNSAPEKQFPTSTTATPDAVAPGPEKLAVEHLPNAWRLTENVISGGLPEGDVAFQELADLGVKTVISVDGMAPDVETAKKYGLRYVHLPHGYDGIPESRAQELAKAVRDLPGGIYIHCHHGKHRSPAAATVACIGAGLLLPSMGESILKTAGTSEHYRGLYQAAREAHPLDQALLDALQVEYPEKAAIPPLADAMINLEHTHDHVKQIAAAQWKAPPKHPALDPAHEALLLREHYTEMLRMDEIAQRPEDFRTILKEGETAGQLLDDALRATPVNAEQALAALNVISQGCSTCHKAHRDTPLSEKPAENSPDL